MAKIYSDVTKTIGNTPLVRINKLTKGIKAEVVAKVEKCEGPHWSFHG